MAITIKKIVTESFDRPTVRTGGYSALDEGPAEKL